MAFMFTWGAQLGSKDRARERRAWFWFARLIAAFSAIAFVSPAVETKSGFHTGVREWAPRLAAGLDMHVDPQCGPAPSDRVKRLNRSEEHTSELQSLMRISYAVFCLNTKHKIIHHKPDKTPTP